MSERGDPDKINSNKFLFYMNSGHILERFDKQDDLVNYLLRVSVCFTIFTLEDFEIDNLFIIVTDCMSDSHTIVD